MGHAARYSGDGAIHYICMDWRHMGEVLAAARDLYELKNLCVWNKTNAGMGTFYRSKHELVFVFKVGNAPHINNFGLGEKGRYRTNVWDYAGVNTFKRGRMDELRTHPTVKPLPLVMDALKDCSNPPWSGARPFVGSGTTLLAAEKTGRMGRAIELDPYYVDAAIGRWQALTGEAAVHAETGQTFDELAAVAPARPTPREGERIMSKNNHQRRSRPGSDKVGYGKPPKHTQFKKGQSGNPKGRPKGSKNLKTLIKEEFFKPVTVVEKGKSIKIPRIRAIVRKITVDALTGGHQEAKLALNTFAKCDDTADANTIAKLMTGQTAFELTPEEDEIITKLKVSEGAD